MPAMLPPVEYLTPGCHSRDRYNSPTFPAMFANCHCPTTLQLKWFSCQPFPITFNAATTHKGFDS